jgi:hypothetical protein
VVQRVGYGRRSVGYRTFDRNGTEVLRLHFRPRAVIADGRPLAARSGLDAEGFTVESAGGGDFVVRVRRDAARSVAIS